MKLSTAIEQGKRHQAFRVTAVDAPASSSFDFSSSVLGKAWLALGYPVHGLANIAVVIAKVSEDTGVDLLTTFVEHPVTELRMTLGGAIVSLDLTYGWTDAKVTAWLTKLGY